MVGLRFIRRILTATALLGAFGCLSPRVFAQPEDLTTVTVEGASNAASAPEASRAIVQSLQTSVARQAVIDIVGEKTYAKNKQLIESRIVRESFKFIPFVTPGTPVKAGDGWKMPVTLRVSKESLRQMVIANGLLFDVEGPAALLPMIAMSDRITQKSYRWWVRDKPEEAGRLLPQLTQILNTALFKEMVGKGFYVLRPTTPLLALALPEGIRSERPRAEDLRILGDYFNAQMVIKGDLRIRESNEIAGGYQISVKLAAVQTANNRSVAEVARTFETEPGAYEAVIRSKMSTALPEVAKDLSVQVVDAWQKGTLGSNLVRLALRGRLNPRQVADFKNSVMRSVREIKSVRERVIEPGGITFEVDFNGGPQQFADRLKAVSLPGFSFKMAGANEWGVVLDVRGSN